MIETVGGRKGQSRELCLSCDSVDVTIGGELREDSRWVSNAYYSAWIDYAWTMTRVVVSTVIVLSSGLDL